MDVRIVRKPGGAFAPLIVLGLSLGMAFTPGRVVKPASPPPPARPAVLPAELVRTFHTDSWSDPAPDPSGMDYWPALGRLVITDSEVEENVAGEPPAYWHGRNVFISTLSGRLTSGCTTYTGRTRRSLRWNDFNNEPTGFAINTDTGHFYFSNDDTENKVYDLGFGADGVYCTPDDTVTRVMVTTQWGATDLEDLAYGGNTLFLADGTNAEVYSVPLGRDGALGGGDDGPVTHWDTAALGFHDLEGIAYNAERGTLFIVSAVGRENYLGETSVAGKLLRAYDLSFMGSLGNLRSDVAWAPSSTDPDARSLYIASRGVDNNTKRLSNDGKIWEVRLWPDAPTRSLRDPWEELFGR